MQGPFDIYFWLPTELEETSYLLFMCEAGSRYFVVGSKIACCLHIFTGLVQWLVSNVYQTRNVEEQEEQV